METMSPVLNVVIDMIVRRVVLEEPVESQSLPVEIFDIPANQLRHILVESKPVGQRQRFNRLLNFLQRFHPSLPCLFIAHNGDRLKLRVLGSVCCDDTHLLVAFDPVSAQLQWTPTFDQAGTYSVTVTATDEGTGSAPGAVLVPSLVPVPLSTSVAISIRVVNVNRGAVLDLPVQATDADGNPLTLIAVSGEGTLVLEEAPLPRFATFQDHGNGQGAFHFAPGLGDRGNYTITLYGRKTARPCHSSAVLSSLAGPYARAVSRHVMIDCLVIVVG